MSFTPIPGCGVDGVIDCDGGDRIDASYELYHNIGDCGLGDDPNETDPNSLAGPSECTDLCQTHCAGLPGNFRVSFSACEGYCRFGVREGRVCSNDIDCTVPNTDPNDLRPVDILNSGECAGGEPVAHRSRCQCECKELGGARSRPGEWTCEEGLLVILETNLPCDGLDPTQIVKTCIPRTTATVAVTIIDADAILGATIEAAPGTGWPASCRQLSQDNLGTIHMVGWQGTVDGALGDQLSPLNIICQGPGYNLGP
jgi:hypothetical protein